MLKDDGWSKGHKMRLVFGEHPDDRSHPIGPVRAGLAKACDAIDRRDDHIAYLEGEIVAVRDALKELLVQVDTAEQIQVVMRKQLLGYTAHKPIPKEAWDTPMDQAQANEVIEEFKRQVDPATYRDDLVPIRDVKISIAGVEITKPNDCPEFDIIPLRIIVGHGDAPEFRCTARFNRQEDGSLLLVDPVVLREGGGTRR
uniref:Uncharacterized protein n=1 Tax=viral metagenome TaxID=1070528 RepID=A0A6M3M0X3_9ZZZZ